MARRHLILLSYYYPPAATVGGVRAAGLAKFLPEYGWRVTVVTPRHSGRSVTGPTVIETDDADLSATIKSALGLRSNVSLKDAVSRTASPATRPGTSGLIDTIKSLIAIPDTNRGWIKIAVKTGTQALECDQFDALLTTSPPVSVHLAGRRLAQHSGLPWVADLRDLWSLDHNSTAPQWRRRLDRILERRTFQTASALVTVSEPLAADLRKLHPETPVHSILNGYDPDEVDPGSRMDDRFTLTHTGTFYQGRRDPTMLFRAVAHLVTRGDIPRDRIRIRLFARHEPWVAHLVGAHGIEDLVELLEWGAREEAVRAQRESQVLLLLHWGGERERGVFTGKIFEYLAARRPIVMIGGGAGVLHDLLEETGAGIHVTDQTSLERTLLDLWREFEADGAVAWQGREELLDRYSHRRMAREFAELLDEVCGR